MNSWGFGEIKQFREKIQNLDNFIWEVISNIFL